MSDEGGAVMALRRRSSSPAAGPLEDEDLLAEILLRLPSKPSSLLRASLVCKGWRSIATDAAFRRRFRTHHREPPILGVFEQDAGELVFTSVLEPPDRIPRERFTLRVGDAHDYWSVLGCRHGRVLTMNWWLREVVVFYPVSGDLHIMAIPPEFVGNKFPSNGAVICSAGDGQDHVHGDCHLSPFKVVLVGTRSHKEPAIARVYSSETRMWGDLVSTVVPCNGYICQLPCTLVGNAVYWWLLGSVAGILQFDLEHQIRAVINSPPLSDIHMGRRIIRAKDSGVGVVILLNPSFQIWDRKVNSHGAATWLLRKTVNMHDILGLPSSVQAKMVAIVGYAEEADAIFISVHRYPYRSFFIVQLESMQSTKGCGQLLEKAYHPFSNFYTAGSDLHASSVL